MVLHDSETEGSVRRILAETCGPAAGDVLVLHLPVLVPLAEATFRKALYKRLSELEAEPRPVARADKTGCPC
jgi:hypothetical protein